MNSYFCKKHSKNIFIEEKKDNIFLFYIIYLLLLFSVGNLFSQKTKLWTSFKHPIKFESLSVEHGLSQSSVLCICQDRRGFMWFGTEDGLNKYDGYTFKIFKPDPGNPHSISNNEIFSIYEDSRGILWIGTNGGGLNRFDREKERFIHYRAYPNDLNRLSSDDINCICEDHLGILWIGTGGGGLNKLIPGEDKDSPPIFMLIRSNPNDPNSLSHNYINSIYEDCLGILWIGTEGGGLNRFDEKRERITRYKAIPNDPGTASLNNVMAINEDLFGMLWIGTQDGLYRFDREKEKFTLFKNDPNDPKSLSHNYVREIYKDLAGVLWIGTDGGGLNKLITGDTKDSPPTFIRYQNDPNNPTGLTSNAIESIYEDRSGVLWIGVYYGGLNKLFLSKDKGFKREKQQFIHYQTIPNNPNTLSHNSINTILEDHLGILWIGTDGGGLNKIVRGEDEEEPLNFFHYNMDSVNPNSLNDRIVTTLYEDSQGVLWIGTYTGGLNKLIRGKDKNDTPTFIHYKHDPSEPGSLSNNFVMSIIEDQSNSLWVGTIRGGLDKFDREKGTFIHFGVDQNQTKSLSDENVTSIFQDHFGNLWIGTVNGLNKYNLETETFTHYLHNPYDIKSLSNNYIRVIYKDRNSVLWIGTNGGGLNKLIPGNTLNAPPTFIHYREKDGLPNNVVYGILEDDNGNLWLSTNKGISKFNPRTDTFKNYDMRDGLQSDEFTRGAFFRSKSGEMFFGGNNGFNVFHPDKIRSNSHIPPIVITDFQILNKSVPIRAESDRRKVLTKTITETKEIVLSYKHYFFSFEFAALHYVSPQKNEYAYMMDGLEKDWNYVGNRRFVTYTTLPPGEYIFRIKGSNKDGIWNEAGKTLKIRITPPFWKTWWFYGLVTLLIIIIILSIHFYRVRQIIIRERKKYEKTSISSIKAEEYLKTLLHFMKTGKPFLDPHLTLNKLSKMVSIPNHYLSQIINNKLKKIFFDFINEYRINEAMVRLAESKEKQKTIQEIANEVGFNSQSAFNRAFKKHIEKTPSDFINEYRIQEAIKMLTNSKEKHKNIQEIASEVGFNSQSAFNRAFKKHTQQTPSDFINEYRIKEAIKMLADSKEKQKNIQEIANEVGFKSQSAFNRAFKKYTNKTPSQYRDGKS